MTRSIFSIAIVAALLSAGPLASGTDRAIPDVALHVQDGAVVRPADYKGKVLLVDFWASWCIPCRASFPALDAMYQESKPRGFEVLAVSLDRDRKTLAATEYGAS